MRAALVNLKTNIVENVIVADAMIDNPAAGYVLVYLPDYAMCNPGDQWSLKILSPPLPNDPPPAKLPPGV